MSKAVSVTDLKAHLSAHLKRVKAGEEILVVERGVVIARLSPHVAPLDDAEEEARMQRLYRDGVIKPGNGNSISELLAQRRRARSTASVLQALLEDRENGR